MRRIGFLLALLMVFGAVFPAQVTARGFVSLPNGVVAQVVEIIDINAIRVRVGEDEALVRLIGLHPNGTDAAINFISREIMGANVTLIRDAAFPDSGRWNYMYVAMGDRFINGELVLGGFGRLNEGHARASQFEQISMGQSIAREAGLGMWGEELRDLIITYDDVAININTATAAQLIDHLDTTPLIANSIVLFRNTAVFQQVRDVAFVPNVTREFFNANRRRMSVSTNINSASFEEINSLAGVTPQQAQAIINSRDNQRFTDLEQLFTRNLMTRWQLDSNLPFISLESLNQIQFARPNARANVNLATLAQLTRAGASVAQAQAIIAQRDALPLRNLQDLNDMTWLFALSQVNALSDNLRTHTNINTAPVSEIESLLGASFTAAAVNNIVANRPYTNINQIAQFMTTADFNRIAPFIYVGERPVETLVNINTANHQQLVAAGFPADVAWRLWTGAAVRVTFLRPSQLPTWITPDLRRISTLYTNINTATSQELLSLDAGISWNIVNSIIDEREHQPFGNLGQIEEFFRGIDQLAMFRRFERFLIVR